jgi:hypothetical protein
MANYEEPVSMRRVTLSSSEESSDKFMIGTSSKDF